uniref:ShKT domain-containing protein n=1 Tax=Acrobeloides nanus TaxID=290746 RepID=A0A914DL71_9BILA
MLQECAKTCGFCANQANVTPSNFSHSCESYYNWLEFGGPDGPVAFSTPDESQPHTFECLASDKYCVEISNDVYGTDEMKGAYFCNVRGCESFNKIFLLTSVLVKRRNHGGDKQIRSTK